MSPIPSRLVKLDQVLREIAGSSVEWRSIDDVAPNDHFRIGRRAGELSLYGAETTEALAERWDTLDDAQRLLAVMVAARAPSPGFVPRLEECVATGQGCLIRRAAVSALAATPSERAMLVLERLGEDADKSIRAAALTGLREKHRLVEIEALERHLEDDSPGVRLEAVQALARTPGERALIGLLAALDDAQMGVALAARKHLLARRSERDLVLDMVARLNDFGERGRYRLPYAVALLGTLEDERAIGPLIEHLDVCRNNEVKKQIAKALSRFKDDRIFPGLWRLARDEHEKVQAAALSALGRRPHAKSVPVLREIVEKAERLGHCPVFVAGPLIEAIAKIPGAASAELLSSCALSSLPRLIHAAVPAIEARGITIAIADLRRRLALEHDETARDELKNAYARLYRETQMTDRAPTSDSARNASGQESTVELGERIKSMSDEQVLDYVESEPNLPRIHAYAFDRLRKIATARSNLQLRRFLKSRSLHARACAAETLEERGVEISRADRLAIVIYRPSRRHEVTEYAQAIGDVLEEVPITEIECTEAMIETMWKSKHPYRVAFAMRWLGVSMNGRRYGKVAFDCLRSEPQVGEPAALDAFVDRQQYRFADPTQLALLLGRFKCKAAVEPIIAKLDGPDLPQAAVKCYAEALGQIGDARAIDSLIVAFERVPEGPALRKIIEALVRLKATRAAATIQARAIKDPKLAVVRDKALAKLRR